MAQNQRLSSLGDALSTAQSNGQLLAANGAGGYYWTTPGGILTVNTTPPASANSADMWLNPSDGILYTYINTGSSSQWIEYGPNELYTPTYVVDGGAANTIYQLTPLVGGGAAG